MASCFFYINEVEHSQRTTAARRLRCAALSLASRLLRPTRLSGRPLCPVSSVSPEPPYLLTRAAAGRPSARAPMAGRKSAPAANRDKKCMPITASTATCRLCHRLSPRPRCLSAIGSGGGPMGACAPPRDWLRPPWARPMAGLPLQASGRYKRVRPLPAPGRYQRQIVSPPIDSAGP